MSSAQTVRALIERQAAAQPQAVYAHATESGAQITYGELVQGGADVAALLRTQGVAQGDTVALVMPNGLATLRLLLGAMQSGRCVCPVNLLSQPAQMRYVLEHSDCKLVLAAPEWAERVRDLVAQLPRSVAVLEIDPDALPWPAQQSEAATTDEPAPEPGDVALLMYTSGTTGQPKGVMLTQANLAANALAIAQEHALTAQDRVLGVLPLYHINAFAVTMLAPLASGGSVAMAPRFSVARFWAQAVQSAPRPAEAGRPPRGSSKVAKPHLLDIGCTWLNLVPTIVSFLLEAPAPAREALAGIRFCRSASAPLPPQHLLAFEQRFGIGVIETMGLTETVAPAFSNPLDAARRKIGSVGRASGGQARVIDRQLNPLPDGATGEVAIRGPHVMRGYYKNPQATADAFTPDGWLRTGDLGHRDADGFFFITGRIKELIIKGGENIAPREVDEALLMHPAVLDAAAVGIPDPHYGQEIMACIVLREGAVPDEAALRAFCEQHLGRYKTPKVFRFVAELPRGPSGKVQRMKLLDGG